MEGKGTVLKGSLLVAGTSIGGGILALPVLTSVAGFFPSITLYFLCWLFMMSTGLLLLEVTQWMKKESNLISMAKYTLGTSGEYFSWVIYLFLFYCLNVAYMVGCGNIVADFFQHRIPDWAGPIIFVIVFAPLILISTSLASRLNVFLFIGLVLSYFAFVFLGFRYVNTSFLNFSDWSKSAYVLPIAFTSFAYQGIVPTLFTYMHHDVKQTRQAILIGSFIPLFAYIIWQWLILGIVPIEGPNGLKETLEQGQNAVHPLKNFITYAPVYEIGQSFAFFALITSFLGVSLGLRDFLADGLKIRKNVNGKILLAVLVFLPPLIISVLYPHIFLIALDYAGGFGCALLLGLLPILMVWKGRYYLHLNHNAEEHLFGGRVVLFLLILFVLFEIGVEIFHTI